LALMTVEDDGEECKKTNSSKKRKFISIMWKIEENVRGAVRQVNGKNRNKLGIFVRIM